jgi:MFS family permease
MDVACAGGVHAHKALGGGCPEAVRHPRWHVRQILAVPALRPMIALYFLIYLAFSMFVAVLPIHAIVDVGCSTLMLGVLYTTLALALGGTETFVLPPLTRKLASPVIAAGGSALLVAAYLMMSASSRPTLLLGGLLYGLGNGLMWPSYLTMLSHSGPPEAQGTVQGVGSSTGSLASIVGTVTGGLLYVTIGFATFYVSAAVAAIATTIFLAHVGSVASKGPSPSAIVG